MKKTNEISKIVGVSKRTLQFYDDEGLIKAERSENNYRLYGQDSLERLWDILLYKEMGIGLDDIKSLLEMSEVDKKEFLKQYIIKIDDEICTLQSQKKLITQVIEHGMPEFIEDDLSVDFKSKIAEIKKKII